MSSEARKTVLMIIGTSSLDMRVIQETESLVKAGFRVFVLGPDFPVCDGFTLPDGVRMVRLRRGGNVFDKLRSRLRLIVLPLKIGAAVVHVRGSAWLLPGALITRLFLRARIVFEPVPGSRLINHLTCLAMKLADRVIVPCVETLEGLDFQGVSGGKIELIGDFPELFRAFTREGLFTQFGFDRRRHKVMIFPQWVKGFDTQTALETARLSHNNAQLRFVFFSHLKDQAMIRELVRNRRLGNTVSCTLPEEDAHALNLFKDASAILLPVTGTEDPGVTRRAVLSAAMAGVPVITGSKCTASGLIIERGIGRVHQNLDALELAKAMLSLIYDHHVYPQVKKKCVQTAQEFNWSNEERNLCELYRRLVEH
ncbi:MAG: hypothetical protein PHQ23_09905 [Candidatus Wallbacteria bacterium]|nr:hypothetical protein [Candidatus Wallbacteria bacterium]